MSPPPVDSYTLATFAITVEHTTETVKGAEVATDFVRLTRMAPMIGRSFVDSDPVPTVILQYRYWQRTFGASPNVLGRTVQVNGRAATIVGVMPKTFTVPADTDVLVTRAR